MAEPHALLAGRYRLVRQVGRGGMGVVWEAWDERLERPVAVKQLRPHVGLDPEEAELGKNRAMREARITARLHHRNAVPVFDVVEHDGQPCLIMQFLPSMALSAVLREGGPLSVDEAARVGVQVASALAAAHRLDIVHRDVKPGNILIADDGTALISDFGISHALGDATLTSTGLVHGTPAYLAPEVARGAGSSFASDVFSLGATLYACLEGGPPFGTDSNSIALLHKVASGAFAPPQRAGALAPVLMEMLRSDPDARPAMAEAASRLGAVKLGAAALPATLPLLDVRTGPEVAPEPLTPVRASRDDTMPTFAAAPAAVAAPVASTPSVPQPQPDPRPRGRRRRGAWALAAVALLVGLALLGTALLTGQLGRGGDETAAAPATVGSSSAAAPASSPAGDDSSGTASASASTSSPSSTSATPSPSPSRTPTPRSGQPTASELEDAITSYYALVPGDLDRAWPRMTADYQRERAGGRRAYERFWGEVDRVSVSEVEAAPPERVEATVTYRRGGGRVDAERTSYRLVREGGVLKIADSTVLSGT